MSIGGDCHFDKQCNVINDTERSRYAGHQQTMQIQLKSENERTTNIQILKI